MALDITGPYRYPPPNNLWLSRHAEIALDPAVPIIDAHHHLWDEPGNCYLADELLADQSSGHSIVATVCVQAHFAHRNWGPTHLRPVGETEQIELLANQLAQRRPKVRAAARIVAGADLRDARLAEIIESHRAAAPERFTGIRQSAARDSHFPDGIVLRPAPAGLLADRSFLEGLRSLGEHGVSFDALVYHEQLPELEAAAAAAPSTTIVLNHFGCPLGVGWYRHRERERFTHWSRDIRRLATQPNVQVKLGGLGMIITGARYHLEENPPDSKRLAADFQPWIETCIEAFGASRCMFESNFPVDKAMYSYDVLWNAFKRVTAGCSAAERHALFHDTAASVYRI